jgi:hypothetical protein
MVLAAAMPWHPAMAAEGDRASPEPVPGTILFAGQLVSVRTVRSGLVVDLPRGRSLVMVEFKGDSAILEPSPPDADLLRQYGVTKIPRYRVSRSRLRTEFLDGDAWGRLRRSEIERYLAKWSALTPDQAERLVEGEPFLGMSLDQAEEALGRVLFSRRRRDTAEGSRTVWRIGRRSRAAELRQFMEGRERGIRARTFEDYLRIKTRALLRFEDGVLVAIERPEVR